MKLKMATIHLPDHYGDFDANQNRPEPRRGRPSTAIPTSFKRPLAPVPSGPTRVGPQDVPFKKPYRRSTDEWEKSEHLRAKGPAFTGKLADGSVTTAYQQWLNSVSFKIPVGMRLLSNQGISQLFNLLNESGNDIFEDSVIPQLTQFSKLQGQKMNMVFSQNNVNTIYINVTNESGSAAGQVGMYLVSAAGRIFQGPDRRIVFASKAQIPDVTAFILSAGRGGPGGGGAPGGGGPGGGGNPGGGGAPGGGGPGGGGSSGGWGSGGWGSSSGGSSSGSYGPGGGGGSQGFGHWAPSLGGSSQGTGDWESSSGYDGDYPASEARYGRWSPSVGGVSDAGSQYGRRPSVGRQPSLGGVSDASSPYIGPPSVSSLAPSFGRQPSLGDGSDAGVMYSGSQTSGSHRSGYGRPAPVIQDQRDDDGVVRGDPFLQPMPDGYFIRESVIRRDLITEARACISYGRGLSSSIQAKLRPRNPQVDHATLLNMIRDVNHTIRNNQRCSDQIADFGGRYDTSRSDKTLIGILVELDQLNAHLDIELNRVTALLAGGDEEGEDNGTANGEGFKRRKGGSLATDFQRMYGALSSSMLMFDRPSGLYIYSIVTAGP